MSKPKQGQAAAQDSRNGIVLYRTNQGWMARFIGPHSQAIRGLFGTDIIPTCYTPQAEAEQVLSGIQARNPGVKVKLA